MAVTKTHPIKSTLKAAIGYICNPEKTDGKLLVSSYGCAAETADCTSQQILDTNHKKIYNKKLSVSQISVRNATCDIELASDSLTNKLDAVH